MMRFFLIILYIASLSAQANLAHPTETPQDSSEEKESQVLPTTPATYEDTILAVVNNDVITTHDLNTRLRIAMQGNVASIPKDQLPSVQKQTLNKLIDEALMLQAIDQTHISVTAQEIEEQIARIEQMQHEPAGTIHKKMKALGIPPEVYQRGIKAQLGWMHYARIAFANVSHVSEKDFEARIKPHENKPRYLLSELRLIFMKPEHQEAAHKRVLTLVAQLEKGAPFAEMAQQVSNAPSALGGGEIAWILESQLPEETADILRSLPTNSITPPILNKEKTYYTIYLLRDKVIPGVTSSPFLVARQMTIKVPSGKDPQSYLEDLRKKLESVTTCQQFYALEDQIPDAHFHILEELPLSKMSQHLQEALKDLPVGQASPGIFNGEDNTIVFFFVCNRYNSDDIPPESKAEASDILSNQRLASHAEKALRDLQRSSLIDVRI
jgi:peptidyl-prolyl cis-trans isomerase SurA